MKLSIANPGYGINELVDPSERVCVLHAHFLQVPQIYEHEEDIYCSNFSSFIQYYR